MSGSVLAHCGLIIEIKKSIRAELRKFSTLISSQKSCDSSVSIATGYRLDD
jgi:hypothetical protein